jgi:hypothetical protein
MEPPDEIVFSLHPHSSNSAKSAGNPPRAAGLAEPFPGTVAQGSWILNVRFLDVIQAAKGPITWPLWVDKRPSVVACDHPASSATTEETGHGRRHQET